MSTQPQEPTRDDVAYRAALRRAETLQAYYTHLLVYGVVNAGLFFINLLTRGDGGNWLGHWAARRGGGIRHRDPHAGGFGGVFSQELEAAEGGRDLSSRSEPFVSDLNKKAVRTPVAGRAYRSRSIS
jgi:hypothetical protein